MTITRETLELAALAAGHVITSFEPVGPNGSIVAILGTNAAGYGTHWRPHTDIADAARLAVRVGLNITMPRHRGDGVAAEGPSGGGSITVYRDSAELAYCGAITLCAAEIGRRMKEAK